MSRVIALIFCLLSSAVWAQGADRPLARAMEALRDGNWAAAQIEARGDGQIALDVILWHYLRAGNGDARQVMDFIARNPDWPGMDYLREKSEIAMAEASHDDVLAFFADSPPQTGTGALALARAHLSKGNPGLAEADIVIAWHTLALSGEEQDAMIREWRQQLRVHHIPRLNMALWRGWVVNARRMIPLVSDDWQTLAKARLALHTDAAGVDTLIAAVPDALRDHPGLAYERFRWRARKNRDADALELLLESSVSAEALGEPWAWADRRRGYARELMRAGDHALAYRISSAHGLTEGGDYADLEWVSGYLLLRFLNEPARALAHFQNHRNAVETPISLGRAGYWMGQAHRALGQDAQAQEAFALGAQYQTSFYGLLAAEAGGIAPDPRLAGTEAFPDWREAAFVNSSVYKAAILLLASGETTLAERFFTHLAEGLDRTQMGQLGALLATMDRPHVQVMLGKRAAQFGVELPGPYYALHPDLIDKQHPVPTELVLAIARRESEFDPVVVSGAGARGLMQLMPGTAKEVSGKLGLAYSASDLLDKPGYNAALGAAYLAELADRFDGNAVMMAAGYNAGPSRPIRWMADRGDPRRGGIDIVDWIELIPFNETRNYVMRVTESLPVYRARLGLDPHPVPFTQELTGSTLLARAPEGE